MADIYFHSWAYHYRSHARCYAIWAYWQNLGRYRLRLKDARSDIKQVMGLTPQQAGNILRQGLRLFWFQKGRYLQLQRPRALRQKVWRDLGVAKRSQFVVNVAILREGIATLRALVSLPVCAGYGAKPFPRAYTSKSLGISRATVSHYRKLLQNWNYVIIRRNFVEVAAEDLGAPGTFKIQANQKKPPKKLTVQERLRRSLQERLRQSTLQEGLREIRPRELGWQERMQPKTIGKGVFQVKRGLFGGVKYYRRLPDSVVVESTKIILTDKPVSLRATYITVSRSKYAEKRYEKLSPVYYLFSDLAHDLEERPSYRWVKDRHHMLRRLLGAKWVDCLGDDGYDPSRVLKVLEREADRLGKVCKRYEQQIRAVSYRRRFIEVFNKLPGLS